MFIYVTSQKSGFHFPRATSRQSHDGPRVYITMFWRNKYIRWNPQFKKPATRATSTTRVACSTTNLARGQNFRDTDLKL
jgi:hypothetical protein